MKYSLLLTLSYTAACVSAAPIIQPVNAALITNSAGSTSTMQPPVPNVDAHGLSTWEHIAVLKNVHVNLGGLGSTSNDRHYKRSGRRNGSHGRPGRPSHVARPGPPTSIFRNGHRNPAPMLAPLAAANAVDKADDSSDDKKSTSSKIANKVAKFGAKKTVKKVFRGSKEEKDCYEDESEEDCKKRLEKEEEDKKSGRNFKKLPVMPTEKINMKRDPLLPIHQVDIVGTGRHFKGLPVQPLAVA